jgi:hypothetical protein
MAEYTYEYIHSLLYRQIFRTKSYTKICIGKSKSSKVINKQMIDKIQKAHIKKEIKCLYAKKTTLK